MPGALAVWIATGLVSGIFVARSRARVIGVYRRGYFATEDLGELLVPLHVWMLAALLGAAIACALLRTRLRAGYFLVALAIHFGIAAAASVYVERQRAQSISALAASADQVVDGIRAYERKNGHMPASLAALAPEFLPAAPGSAVDSPLMYSYEVDLLSRTWKLTASAGPVRFHCLPPSTGRPDSNGDYRIGDWVVRDTFR